MGSRFGGSPSAFAIGSRIGSDAGVGAHAAPLRVQLGSAQTILR